jgi:CRP/FNR family transcriptional regulator, cyclic AMP receptor protein
MKQLSLIEKAFFLKKTRLFQDLDLDLLVAIADKMNQDVYETDEKVFSPNQRANRMYLIASGKVNLLDEKEQLLAQLTKADFFGDESLFNNKERAYLAVCAEQTLFLTLSKSHLLNVLSECPSVAIALLQSYAQNMKSRYLREKA